MKRKTLIAIFTLMQGLTASAGSIGTTPISAFPGAEGAGMYTTGGRGGRVIHVTTLADDGREGTFRQACEQSGRRTIVFDVSGTIFLRKPLQLTQGDVTIAGQSAPGDGICIADYPFTIQTNNVILRYVRFRLGERHATEHEGDGLGCGRINDVIIDHCSVSWSIDETLSIYGGRRTTVQWCIAAQSLCNAGHRKGAHGYGAIWGGHQATFHHNLLAHHTSRTPRLGPAKQTQTEELTDMRNNVIYNWAGDGCYGGEGMKVNIVNNYYKPGPATMQCNETLQRRIFKPGVRTTKYTRHGTERPNVWDVMWHVWGKYYVSGNVNTVHADVTADNWSMGIYNQIDAQQSDGTYTAATHDSIRLDTPLNLTAVRTTSAEEAYTAVLRNAGCSRHRDTSDSIIVSDVEHGTATFTSPGELPGIINSQADGGGWPLLRSLPAMQDTDGDGMPDEWEDRNGLDKNNPADGAATTADGYTNLEHYLNELVAEPDNQ